MGAHLLDAGQGTRFGGDSITEGAAPQFDAFWWRRAAQVH
jgi:hypothetical protein